MSTTLSERQSAQVAPEQAHFDAISSQYYDVVDRLPFDLGYFHQEELRVVAEQLGSARNLRVLDAGCGPGRHTLQLARLGHDVTAVDFSGAMLAETRRVLEEAGLAPAVRTLQVDVRSLPLEPASFDAIVCLEVLEHLPAGVRDIRQTLAEFSRLLKPGGKLIVEAPLPSYLELVQCHDDFLPNWSRIPADETQIYERTPLPTQNQLPPELVESLLSEHGFQVDAVRYVRVLPSGLIERYPLLERFDRALEQLPETGRLAREAIWIARRGGDEHSKTQNGRGGNAAPTIVPSLVDPLHQTVLSVQRTLTAERREVQRLQTELGAAQQNAEKILRLQEHNDAAQQTRRQLEKSIAGKEAELHGLHARLASLGKQLHIAEQRREGLRAALAREQQARRLLEHSVTAGYRQSLTKVADVVAAVVPRRATVLVVSKGDESLLQLKGRRAWHFPRAESGEYAGHHPADSGAAIEHLESLRTAGGDYLLLPNTLFWWLDHYREFREHLDAHYARVWDDERFVIFDLARSPSNGRHLSWPTRVSDWLSRFRPKPETRPRARRGNSPALLTSVTAAEVSPQSIETPVPGSDLDEVTPSVREAASPLAGEEVPAARQAVIFAAVPYDDIGGGQRPAQLTRALLRRNWRVTYIYIYPRADMTTGAALESNVSLPRLLHLHIDDIAPDELLAAIRSDTPLIFEVPHPQFVPFAELAWKRGLPTVFELIDDWETSLGGGWFDRDVLELFARRSTMSVGTARALVESLRRLGAKQLLYSPNAADETVFDAYSHYARPRDLPSGYHKLLLYFGSMYGEWFGWEYIKAAAEQNSQSAFVMIGAPPRTTDLPANVIFLGPKENHELPAYLAHADAALIPFIPGRITDAVSPIKAFEYLFLKKPVIATRMPELDGYPSVFQASSPEEFARLCGTLPIEAAAANRDHELDLFISRNSWNARLDALLNVPKPTQRFSFIILIHNNRRVIGRCLTTLLEHTRGFDAEVIVVDNASTDDGAEFVEREFPQVKLLRNTRNGCSTGRNLGAAAAMGDCLVFLDSDQWFASSSWLFEASHLLDRYPAIGALGWFAGWFDPGFDSLAGPTVDHLPNRGRNAQMQRLGFRTDVAYLGAGGLFVPRSVWQACGGFDPAFDPHTFEDTDFSFQVRKAGFRLAYRDLCGIRHEPHQTSRSPGAQSGYRELFEGNSARFKQKWADYLDLFAAEQTAEQADEHNDGGLSPRERLTATLRRTAQTDALPVVYTTPIDWNLPMFQRPQQMALALGALGHTTFYMTPNHSDQAQGVRQVAPNCWLTPLSELPHCMESLERFVLVVVSTSPLNSSIPSLDAIRDRAIVVYDYIDDMHDDIHPVSEEMRKAHHYFLTHSDLVCATADRLREQALRVTRGSVASCPNGADVDHFRLRARPPAPPEIAPLVAKSQPIIGYFGALAKWFDYELIRTVSKQRPQWQMVLIGVDYDGSLSTSGITKLPNVHYLGTRAYDSLPHYAAYFDVATVPFLINDVTQSTSPIKLFEYMAARKPIVTTDLRECRKYKPVLIGRTHEEFIVRLEEALLRITDPEYLAALDREADENSWQGRARDMMSEVHKLAEFWAGCPRRRPDLHERQIHEAF